MKTVLINPPQKTSFPQPPLGLAYVAASMEKKNLAVEIIDAPALKLDNDKIVKKSWKAEAGS